MNYSVVDLAAAQSLPCVCVPHDSRGFERLSEPGQRLLLARDGLWLETCREWLYARFPVRVAAPLAEKLHGTVGFGGEGLGSDGPQKSAAFAHTRELPFGVVQAVVEYAFAERDTSGNQIRVVPEWFVAEFMAQARDAYPKEAAGYGVWSSRGGLRLVMAPVIEASAGGIRSSFTPNELGLMDDESVVIDIHSHGTFPAFFSGVDRHDMGRETVLALVAGRIALPQPELIGSLFAFGFELLGGLVGMDQRVRKPAAVSIDALTV